MNGIIKESNKVLNRGGSQEEVGNKVSISRYYFI